MGDGQRRDEDDRKVYVGNLSYQTTEGGLQRYFESVIGSDSVESGKNKFLTSFSLDNSTLRKSSI